MKFGRTKILRGIAQKGPICFGSNSWRSTNCVRHVPCPSGGEGLIAFWQLHGQVMHAQHIHDGLRNTKERLQNRVKLLNPNSLDTDMLEERVRFMLGYSRPDETIILKR